MANETPDVREGSLDAPTRHALDWKNPEFYAQDAIDKELHRVFDICHGCRRCVSLCNAFPTLFDLVDESSTMEVDGVSTADYAKIVDQCYLCDLCYQTKCPYVPPHPWNVDFPHLMLRAKAARHKRGETKLARKDVVRHDDGRQDRDDSARRRRRQCDEPRQTDAQADRKDARRAPRRPLAEFDSRTARRRLKNLDAPRRRAQRRPAARAAKSRSSSRAIATARIRNPSRISSPVFKHNGIAVELVSAKSAAACRSSSSAIWTASRNTKRQNIPVLAAAVRDGWDITAAIPSCVLMFRQELPLMFPDDEDVQLVKRHTLRSVRISVAAPSGEAAEDGVQECARQSRVARAVPSARAEHRPENARRARARSRHRSDRHRTLFGPRRHLRRQGGNVCDRAQDRAARREPHQAGRAGSLRERLSDGGIASGARDGR